MVEGGLPLFLLDFLWLCFIFLIFLGRFKGTFGFQRERSDFNRCSVPILKKASRKLAERDRGECIGSVRRFEVKNEARLNRAVNVQIIEFYDSLIKLNFIRTASVDGSYSRPPDHLAMRFLPDIFG